LMMPHFSTVLKTERDSLKKEIEWALMNKFVAKELRHNDVEWRNIGNKYKDESGATRIVLFDLEDLVASSRKQVGALALLWLISIPTTYSGNKLVVTATHATHDLTHAIKSAGSGLEIVSDFFFFLV
jgi:hypothetical protein